jgi:hypothetical protein
MRQNHHEDRAETGAERRAEPADDDHREILDQHVELERLHRDEAGVVGPERTGDTGE